MNYILKKKRDKLNLKEKDSEKNKIIINMIYKNKIIINMLYKNKIIINMLYKNNKNINLYFQE
jgi:hypothetical protein